MVPIGRATSGDVPALAELLARLFSIEMDFTVDPERQRRGLDLLVAQPDDRATILVARDRNSQAVGMVSAQLVISTAEGGPSAWIEDVVVAPEYQNQGIGRALLQAVLQWAVTQGATRAQLLADQSNESALEFYRHLGWSRTSLIALRMPRLR